MWVQKLIYYAPFGCGLTGEKLLSADPTGHWSFAPITADHTTHKFRRGTNLKTTIIGLPAGFISLEPFRRIIDKENWEMTTEEITARFDVINRHNADLLTAITRPDFEGDIMLDPTLNKAQTFIHLANEAVVLFPQGAFPLDIAEPTIESTEQLLTACEKRYGLACVRPMAQAFHALENLWYYAGQPTHPPETFLKKVFIAEDRLITAICAFSREILAQSTQKKPPKRRGHFHGKKNPRLHKDRAEVVAEIRKRKTKRHQSWAKVVAEMRINSSYVARMRGKSDATWIRYAKSGFLG